jgi:hypothetical protein
VRASVSVSVIAIACVPAGGIGCSAGCGRGEPAAPPPSRETTGSAAAASGAQAAAVDGPASGAPCPVAAGAATLGPGLTVERWPIAATPAAGGPACVDVVRADLARYALRALSASGPRADAPTAPAWRDESHLAAVTNAGMFHDDGAPVGLIVAAGTVRGADNPKMSGFLAWDPVSPSDPPVLVAGRNCAGFDLAALRRRYRSLVQSYRFLGCDGAALPWQDPKQYSAAGIGVDRAGRVVFLHARAAVTMAELAKALASHDLAGALFLEGGPEASLVARGPSGSLERVGSYETGFFEDDSNHRFWALPNVIGLLAR